MSLQKKNKNKIKNLHGSNPAIRQIQRIKKHAFELLLYKWPVRHFVKITGFQMIFKSHLERKNSFKE